MLSEQLAFGCSTVWVPEYAREYLALTGGRYSIDDIVAIAKGQIDRENEAAARADRLLFCDTDLLVTKIWCEVKYGHCPRWIEDHFRKHRYDLYLLCDIDLPWEYDPLREHPDKRPFLFERYRKALSDEGLPYRIISGSGPLRLQNALLALESVGLVTTLADC